jgi:hypothetical protein
VAFGALCVTAGYSLAAPVKPFWMRSTETLTPLEREAAVILATPAGGSMTGADVYRTHHLPPDVPSSRRFTRSRGGSPRPRRWDEGGSACGLGGTTHQAGGRARNDRGGNDPRRGILTDKDRSFGTLRSEACKRSPVRFGAALSRSWMFSGSRACGAVTVTSGSLPECKPLKSRFRMVQRLGWDSRGSGCGERGN